MKNNTNRQIAPVNVDLTFNNIAHFKIAAYKIAPTLIKIAPTFLLLVLTTTFRYGTIFSTHLKKYLQLQITSLTNDILYYAVI